MKFPTEKYISNFIQNQFPDFYDVEGPDFKAFVEMYYEWLEDQNDITTGKPNPVAAIRNILDYKDIDNTLEEFLVHFQKKYLYGVPFNVIINKRFLLKHVLDVYRSKGSVQCFKLLFKLIYNQDLEIYLPKNDIFKLSDGTWIEPRYVEVSDNGQLASYIGKTVVGLNSQVTAVVENYTKEKIGNGILSTLYISNIKPESGDFIVGEKILPINYQTEDIQNASSVLGSLREIMIINGGVNFSIGDILKVANKDLVTGKSISFGTDGLIKITKLTNTKGNINFNIVDPGAGYILSSDVFLYNNGDNPTKQAAFHISSLSYQNEVSYNKDLLCNYLALPINANSYGFPANTSANSGSIIKNCLTYDKNIFGSIGSLDTTSVGQNYTNHPFVFLRSLIIGDPLQGTVSYNTNSSVITGNNTLFTNFFAPNSVFVILANNTAMDKQIVLSVANNTSLTLYSPPQIANNSNVHYTVGSTIFPANFVKQGALMYNENGTLNGNNAVIDGVPSFGNNNAAQVKLLNSGKGYLDGENITAYLYNCLTPAQIVVPGRGYSNNDTLNFIGDPSTSYIRSSITTDSNGSIVSVTHDLGSNFSSAPNITINTSNGTGATLTTDVSLYNDERSISGVVSKSGIGIGQGYWSTTRGFLNSDKYIQDSYFYQDFSYQIKTGLTLDKYKDIIYDTFHPTGSEMFGEYYYISNVSISNASFTNVTVSNNYVIHYTADSTINTADDIIHTADMI